MNIDEKIKHELESEVETIDEILNDKQGMFGLATGSYKGSLGKWMILATVIILIVTSLMIWCGFEFFLSDDINERVFWGVCLLFTLILQAGLKQWTWMEMNRNSLLREVKRLEIAVAKLNSKVEYKEQP